MISSSSCARVVPFAALAVLFPAVSYGQDVGEGEISLENLMDMVVTATLREQSTLDAPASIQVVTAADIRSRGYRNIKQIMNDVPGFNDVSDTNEEVVAVRGVFTSTTNKVLTLVNGHRMNDLMLGRYNADQFLGVDSIERIEFIRGPASALYGSGALVGIINIITKKGADLSAGQVKLQAGVYGQEASASWGRQLVGYDVFFNFTYLDQEGQTLDQGSELDAFRRTINGVDTGPAAPGKVYIGRYRQNMSGLFTLRSESSSLALRAAHFRRATPRGSNGAFYDYEMETLKPAYTENDFFGDYQYNWTFGKNKITFNPSIHFFSYYEQSFITWGVNRVGGNGQRSGTMGEYTNYQMKLNYERQIHETLNFIGGVDGLMARFYRSDAITSQAPSPTGNNILLRPMSYTAPGNWFLGGAFAQAVFTPVQQVAITAGARFDTFEDEADARLTPRVGVVVKPVDALAVKLLYGQSYLAPMWAHTRANDGNFFVSSVCATLANPPPNCRADLKLTPETFTGYNMIVAYGDKKANVTADFFYNKVEGLINGVNFTTPPNMENPMMPYTPPCSNGTGCVRYENSANSTYMGAELSGEAQVMSWLRLNGSYSFIRPDTSDPKSASLLWKSDLADPNSVTGNILGVPRHTLRYGVKVEPVSNLSLLVWGRAYLAHKAADFRAAGDAPNAGNGMTAVAADLGLTSVPAVALFDAAINYNYNQWAFQLVGRNLTNRYYEMGGAVPRPLAREKLNVEGTVSMKF